MTTTMPPWLAQHIADTTGAPPNLHHLQHRRCPHCRAHVLIGLSDTTCATTVTIDPAPLTPTGEALAQLAGRWTYNLTRRGRHYQLRQRDRWHIASQSPDHQAHDVVADHTCHAPLPAQPSVHQPLPAAARGGTDDQPPF